MSQIKKGTDISQLAIADSPDWKIGYFVEHEHPFHRQDFEMKWSKIKPKQIKSEPGKNKTAHTVTILLRGQFTIKFPDKNETVEMKTEGAYVYFPPGICHSWENPSKTEEALLITLRWPSVKDDQVAC